MGVRKLARPAVAGLLTALVAAIPASHGDTGPGSLAPPETSTRQTIFRMPFRIERAASPNQQVTEVYLHYSLDEGRTWKTYGRVHPSKGYFLFRAVEDGKYWFAIRSVDRIGNSSPPYVDRPAWIVTIDTLPPALRLEATRAAQGSVIARWYIEETNLLEQSLTLQYRSAGGDWRPVDLREASTGNVATSRTDSRLITGQVAWRPERFDGPIEIRAEAADIADNQAVTHARLEALPAQPASPPDLTCRWTPTQNTARKQGITETIAGTSEPAVAQPHPLYADQFQGKQPTPVDSVGRWRPADAKIQAINLRLFEQTYYLDNPTTTGPVRAELWATSGRGQPYTRIAVDEDGKSPMIVAVTEDRLYGFVLRIRDPRDQADSPPPPPETPPDSWVRVDVTPPQVRILGVEPAAAGRANVRWETRDAQMASDAVTLWYRENSASSWKLIVAGIADTGSHAWSPQVALTGTPEIRIQVRDAAGNTSSAQLAPRDSQTPTTTPPQTAARLGQRRPVGHAS